jgi:hypothetical protein
LLIIAAASGLLATSASASRVELKLGPNLVANGGFESGLSGWSTTGFFAQGFDFGVDGQAHTGNNAFFGGAIGGLGFLTQTIATTPGRLYGVTLWLASDGFLPNEFQVLANNTSLLDSTDLLIQGYRQISLSFVASSAATTLRFGFRNDSGLLHLDDVNTSLAPEPATLLLIIVGLGALRVGRRSVR